MIIEGEGGVTHINIYSKSKCELGRYLSNFAYSPIIIDGRKCASIEGYWYYLLTGNEQLLNLYGFNAKHEGKKYKKICECDAFFMDKIKLAIDIKIKSNRYYLNLFYKSELPFTHYYDYNGKRVDAGYEWIVEHIELRRKQLKEHFK